MTTPVTARCVDPTDHVAVAPLPRTLADVDAAHKALRVCVRCGLSRALWGRS